MLEPGKILGPYRIERELGAGAMGTVWKAVRVEDGETFAIKMIGIGLANNETAVARFEREADILKQLRSPHIVRLFGTGKYKRTPFIVMEYVEGESLDKVFERRGRLDWQEVVRLGKQLCKALRHAHEKGIIHRDLKPSNLMILKDGTLKLTDFGIAKDTDVTALTGANSTVGTAAYMSPEQCKGERSLSLKSDLYSLGVVFYELLTGVKPFQKESAVEMFLAHVNDEVERPSRKVLDIPPWLDTLVCQLMEKKPEHRPFDAAMVAKALDEVDAKMAEQKSAGLDLVQARAVDRPRANADEGDRDAARVLRGAAKKKRIRTRPKAFYEKGWFLAVSLPLVLAGVAAGFWWMTRPPGAEAYYARVESALTAGNRERAREVAQEFVTAHPTLADANARQLRQWHEELEVEQLAKAMHNRFRRQLSPDGEWQSSVYAALRHEDAGEIADARRVWTELAEKGAAAQGEEQVFSWLAKNKLRELGRVKAFETTMHQVLDTPGVTPAHDAERRTAEATRAERFGDLPLAVDRYSRVKDDFIKELEHRPYVLLAAAKVHELKPKAVVGDDKVKEFRIDLVTNRLAQVETLVKERTASSNRAAELLCRDLVALYGKDADPALAPLAQKAAERLSTIPRSGT